MKNKIEDLIREVGINEVESVLNQMKSKINVKENLKEDFVDSLTGCTISFFDDDIEYVKDGKLLFFYNKKKNCFHFNYKIWSNFKSNYNLNCQELSNLLIDIVEEVLNYKSAILGQVSGDPAYK